VAVKCLADGRWAVYYRDAGKLKWEYFGRGDLSELKAKQRDEQIKEERGKSRPPLAITVAQLLSEYHSKHRVQASTADSDFYRIDRVLLPLLGAHCAEMLTNDQIDHYVSERTKSGKSLATIDRELDILRSAYSWGESRNPPLIVRNPIRGYRLTGKKSRPTAKINPVSQEDLRKLLRFAPPHLLRGMLIQWYCGQRPGKETLNIKWLDVDFERAQLLIHAAHKGSLEERYVPISNTLLPLLEQWRKEDESFCDASQIDLQSLHIVHYKGSLVKSLKRTWATTKQKAGILRKLRLYDFRHAWFTNALARGADLKSVSEIGGHSDVATTLTHYQHTVLQQHRDAVEAIPKVPIPKKNELTIF
jgi:integrase